MPLASKKASADLAMGSVALVAVAATTIQK